MKRMQIYIQVVHSDGASWYNDDGVEQYLMDGRDLICVDSLYGDYERGTAFPSGRAAVAAAKNAVRLAMWNGWYGISVKYWRIVRDRLMPTRLDRAGFLKKSLCRKSGK